MNLIKQFAWLVLTLLRRGESAAMGVFLMGESGGVDLTEEEGEMGGRGEMDVLVQEEITSSLKL